MGTDSYLLYIEPATAKIDTTTDPALWDNLFYYDKEPRILTADELGRFCEGKSYKVLDYMTYTKAKEWNRVFASIFASNPDLPKLTFHFWCSDAQAPFLMIAERGKPFDMWVGSYHCIHWSKKVYETVEDRLKGNYEVEFSLEKYKRFIARNLYNTGPMNPVRIPKEPSILDALGY